MACSCNCNWNCTCNVTVCQNITSAAGGTRCASQCICQLNKLSDGGQWKGATWNYSSTTTAVKNYWGRGYSEVKLPAGGGGQGCWCHANWGGKSTGSWSTTQPTAATGGANWACTCNCNCNANTVWSKPATGGTKHAPRTLTSFGTASSSTKVTAAQMTLLQTALTTELSVRDKTAVTWTTATSKAIDDAIANQIRNAIVTATGSDIGAVSTSTKVLATWYNNAASQVNTLQGQCICQCNYCTCNCNKCTCNVQKTCECNCNYCTCNCNYCTCNCNYCTCQCHYCTCNCNYCTCTCNYCTCQCNNCG